MARFLIVVKAQYMRDAQFRLVPVEENETGEETEDFHDDDKWGNLGAEGVFGWQEADTKQEAILAAAAELDDLDPEVLDAYHLADDELRRG